MVPLGLVGLATVVAGCGHAAGAAGGTTPSTLTLSSSVAAPGAALPERYTCSGDNVAPPLSWSGPAAAGWALTLVDADAHGTVLWVATGIPAKEHATVAGQLPAGAVEGQRSDGGTGYYGPCPPQGSVRHYVFTVYGLTRPLTLSASVPAAEALRQITADSSETATLRVQFAR